MPLPLTGTATVTEDDDIIGWSGAPLSSLNCVPGATVALDGRTYFAKERISTGQLRVTRPYSGPTGSVPAEIEQLSPQQVATATLNKRAAEVMSQINALDANGRGLFYNLIGVTGDNDPGPGNLALNQIDLEDVSEIYMDVLDANDGGRDVSGIIDLWPNNTVLIVRSLASNAYGAWRLLNREAEAGYRRLDVSFVSRDGDFGAEPVSVEWRLAGADRDVDAEVQTPMDLATHDGAVPPFRVLVRNYDGAGRAARVSKLSAAAGAWSAPAWWTGPQGLQGPIGPRGITWLGAWDNTTSFSMHDGVLNNGSSWRSLQNGNLNHAPPVLPTTSNAWWMLVAAKGIDGTGTGDVIGPPTSDDGRFAAFDGLTGKLLKGLTSEEATAGLNVFVGDSGAGGGKGVVPAPAAGDAAARRYLGAAGGWSVPGGQPVATVAFTFDYYKEGGYDAFSNVMSSRNLVGTYYVAPNTIGVAGHVTSDNLLVMLQSGWEIGWYTNENMVTAQAANRTTCFAKFKTARADMDAIGIAIKSVAPNQRAWNAALAGMAFHTGFLSVRNVGNFAALQTWPVQNPWWVENGGSASWSSSDTLASLVSKLDTVIAAKAWWTPVIHKIGASPDGFTISTTVFTQFMDYVKTKVDAGQLRVARFTDALRPEHKE